MEVVAQVTDMALPFTKTDPSGIIAPLSAMKFAPVDSLTIRDSVFRNVSANPKLDNSQHAAVLVSDDDNFHLEGTMSIRVSNSSFTSITSSKEAGALTVTRNFGG